MDTCITPPRRGQPDNRRIPHPLPHDLNVFWQSLLNDACQHYFQHPQQLQAFLNIRSNTNDKAWLYCLRQLISIPHVFFSDIVVTSTTASFKKATESTIINTTKRVAVAHTNAWKRDCLHFARDNYPNLHKLVQDLLNLGQLAAAVLVMAWDGQDADAATAATNVAPLLGITRASLSPRDCFSEEETGEPPSKRPRLLTPSQDGSPITPKHSLRATMAPASPSKRPLTLFPPHAILHRELYDNGVSLTLQRDLVPACHRIFLERDRVVAHFWTEGSETLNHMFWWAVQQLLPDISRPHIFVVRENLLTLTNRRLEGTSCLCFITADTPVTPLVATDLTPRQIQQLATQLAILSVLGVKRILPEHFGLVENNVVLKNPPVASASPHMAVPQAWLQMGIEEKFKSSRPAAVAACSTTPPQPPPSPVIIANAAARILQW